MVLNKLEEQWGGHRFASLGRRLVKEGDLVKISRRYGKYCFKAVLRKAENCCFQLQIHNTL